ncbi:MAG: hypothetical protein JXX29_24320 [Deltaproteobacteria bacterium]|nr:hypothetical protein [Deltaproteobacteria bacterium]
MNREEYRQRLYIQICIFVSMPILLYFGLRDLFSNNGLSASLPELSVAVLLVVTSLTIRKRKKITVLLRFPMAAIGGLILYNLYTAPGEGSDLLWMYTFPVFAFAVFGRTEGLIWNFIVLTASLAMIFFPQIFHSFPYSDGFAVRYAISIAFVTTLSYATESMRMKFYIEIQDQKQQIQDAMADIKTLSGLLPICATCKKIRDDNGYWQSLETYLSTHTQAMLSHGICVSCLHKTSPEVYQEMLDEGLIRESHDVEPPYRITSEKPLK